MVFKIGWGVDRSKVCRYSDPSRRCRHRNDARGKVAKVIPAGLVRRFVIGRITQGSGRQIVRNELRQV